MLERNRAPVAEGHGLLSWDREREFVSLSDITLFLKRNYLYVTSFVILGLIFSSLYIATSDPIYTARTQILIEPKIPQLLQQQTAEVNLSLDTSQVETQLAVLRSEKIAMMVIEELDLAEEANLRELHATTLGERLGKLLTISVEALGIGESRFFLSESQPEADSPAAALNDVAAESLDVETKRRAVEIFGNSLSVHRVGVSYVVDIYFRSRDPELSARIANATAGAFVREQLETRTAAASEGLRWLESRIEEVRAQMNAATQIAQEFRAKHDYRIGSPDASEGGQSEAPGPTLEELEVTADTYRKMYESLLAAFTSSVNQQPYLIADARVITVASPPLAQSHPRKTLVIAFGLMAGLMLGAGLALARHVVDRTLRTPSQVRQELGLECVGELPVVRFRRGGFGRFDEVARHSQSTFSTSLRSAKAAIAVADVTQPVRSVGIISASPGDGKSTVASNLAALYARSGKRTLLIDADIYHSALTKGLANAEQKQPEIEVVSVAGEALDLLPSSAATVHDLLSAKDMQRALKGLDCYEVIVVDLPPFTSSASGLGLCPLLDGVIIVAEWGKTPTELVAELSRALRATKTSVVGVLLTKVRWLSMHRYRRRALQPPR